MPPNLQMPNLQMPTLRERRRSETREQIRGVALALVEERGYAGVTVDLISERAGVSVRTFFNYFADKESAMIAVPPPLPGPAAREFLARAGSRALFPDLADLAVRMFEEEDAASPSSFQASIRIVMSVPALAQLQHRALADREAEFIALVAERSGQDPDDEEPAVIVAAFTGAIGVACRRWSRDPDRRSFSDQVRACVTLLSTRTGFPDPTTEGTER